MATCARESGFLFWKKRCDRPSIGACGGCRLFVCQMHGGIQGDGGVMCHACLHTGEQDSDSDSDAGSGLSWSSGSSSTDSTIPSDSGSSSSDSGGSSDSSSSSSSD